MAQLQMPKDPKGSSSIHERSSRSNGKRKMRNERKEKNNSVAQKKGRLVWTDELHNRFLAAMVEIGLEKATPKKILEQMKASRLSRENVASHLQKFREFLKKENGRLPDPTHSRHLISDMHNPSLIPTGHPSLIYTHPQGSFQYSALQQNPSSLFQPRFEGMPLVGPPQFHNNKVGNNNFMCQARYGQLGSVSNSGNLKQLWIGNAPVIAQETVGGYQNFALGEPLRVDNSNCAINPVQSMFNQQPQGRAEFFRTTSLGQNFANLNSQGQNSNPYSANLGAGNIGSFRILSPSATLYPANGCSTRNNYAQRQMPYPAAVDVVNPTAAYVGEMSTVDHNTNQMNEILKGKKPMEKIKMSPSVPNFNNLSTSSATQEGSSLDAYVNLEKFLVAPPPQKQLEGEGFYDLVNFIKNTSQCDLSDCFEQGNQSTDQVQQQCGDGKRCDEGFLGSAVDLSEFMLYSPMNNVEQEPLDKERSDLE